MRIRKYVPYIIYVIVFSFFSITFPQFKHFQPSKLIKWLKKDCIIIKPLHFGHFITPPHQRHSPCKGIRLAKALLSVLYHISQK